jgi:YesN/AraC family two-component response regulator
MEIVKYFNPRIILIDIDMSGLNGIDLLNIRKDPALKSIFDICDYK